ncbi:hypothetical protein ACO0QE_001564 [Hanseniaspora vineae]
MSLINDVPLSFHGNSVASYEPIPQGATLINQRQHITALLSASGSTGNELKTIDTKNSSFNLIDTLTLFIESLLNSNVINDDLVVSLLLLSKQYHLQAHEILHQNYEKSAEEDHSWNVASRYFQLAIGVLKFTELQIFPLYTCLDPDLLKIWNVFYHYNVIYSQFSMVILGLYKLKDSLFDNYSQQELSKQTKLQGLSFNMLAKILINIYNTCNNCITNLASLGSSRKSLPGLRNFVIFQQQYIYGLIELFLSLQSFEIENKIGLSCSYIKHAIGLYTCSKNDKQRSSVFHPYMVEMGNLILKNQKKSQELKSLFKTKYLAQKNKFKNKTQKVAPSIKHHVAFCDSLVKDTFQDFIAPLLYMLEYRYDHFNNTVALEPIITDEQELQKSWPVAMGTPLKYINWSFKNGKLATETDDQQNASAASYF